MKTISKIFTLLSVLMFMSSCGEDVIESGGMGVKMVGVIPSRRLIRQESQI